MKATFLVATLCVLLAGIVGCGGGSRSTRSTAQVAEEIHAPAAIPAPTPPRTVFHTVEPGQTLWSIARRYGVNVDVIVSANGIVEPDRVESGTRLRIPGATTTTVAAVPVATGGDWNWPVHDGHVLSYFGAPRRTHKHQGIDIGGRRGEPVVAAQAGRVIYADSTMRGYGKTVILDHGNGLRSLYAHNSALLVEPGDRVDRGEAIARVGRTGNASTEHCHFEIRLHEVPVNPLNYVSTRLADSEVTR